MALNPAMVRMGFTGGVETKLDAKTVPMTKLLTLENGVFVKGSSIVKRNGYEDVSRKIDGTTAKLTGARRLARRGSELLAFTTNRCYSQQPGDANQWVDAGPVFSVISSDEPAVRTGTMQTVPDHADNGGARAYAWEDSEGGVWWSVVDSSTGRVCRAPEQLDADGQRPRCVPCGSLIHVYWANPTQRSIFVAVCNPSRPSAPVTPRLLVEDLNASNPVYDACPTNRTGSPALMVWAEFATTNIRVGYVDASGVLGSPVTGHPSVVREAVALAAASPVACAYLSDSVANEFAIAYQTANVVEAQFYASPGTDETSPITPTADSELADVTEILRITCGYATDGSKRCYVAAEEDATEPSNHYVLANWATSADDVGDVITLRSVGLASRAFQPGGDGADVFATFVHDTTYFNTYLVARLSDFHPNVARILPGLGAGLCARSHVPSAHIDSGAADEVAICLPYRERLLSENHDRFTETGLRLVSLEFDSEDSHTYAPFSRSIVMAGACPTHYDGRLWSEQGFHVGPELIVAVKASGGSMSSSVTYVYRAWYEWTDAQGEVHRGPVSIGTRVAMGVGDTQVTLTLPTLRLTTKTNVRICVARSEGNKEAALYRITSADPRTAGDPNGFVANDPTVDTVTVIDRMSDADLSDEEPLYTNGGILSNDPAPLGSVIAGGKSRLFTTDSSDPDVVRFSQELDVGYGAEFPPELFLRCDPYGGRITGLAVMDGFGVIFKEHAIYTFAGDGPLRSGDTSQSGFSQPELVPGDMGCTDPNSIVLMPLGVMFKSAIGIAMVDRSRAVSYVGAPVEAYNAQAVRRATRMENRTYVLFLTDEGKTLLYDYFFQQWSTFTNHAGYDAVIVDGRYHYLRTDERVFRETPGEYSDAGRAIKLRLETAWIRMREYVQTWQRFWHLHIIGERKSAHQLKCQYRTDYGKHWSEPEYFDATGAVSPAGWVSGWDAGWVADEVEDSIVGSSYGDGAYGEGNYGGTPPGLYQWRFHLGLNAQAVQFRFEDFELVNQAGPSFELTEIVVTGGSMGNVPKPFAASRSI